MFCSHCGKKLPEDAIICQNCGHSTNSYTNYAPPDYPMKWYKFLIYFYLYASAAVTLIYGLGQLTGANYQGVVTSQLYREFPLLKTMDVTSGLLMIGIAAFAVYTRFRLAGFRKNGPKCLTWLYILSIAVAAVYLVGTMIAVGEKAGSVFLSVLPSLLSNLASSGLMIFLNWLYFDKRADLFIH